MKAKSPQDSEVPKDPPALVALKRAAKIALELAIATGTPCYVWQEGKIVDIAASTAGKRRGRREKNLRERKA